MEKTRMRDRYTSLMTACVIFANEKDTTNPLGLLCLFITAREGTRTPTPSLIKDFESFASAIPPLGLATSFIIPPAAHFVKFFLVAKCAEREVYFRYS